MVINDDPNFNSLEWRPATYYGERLDNWLISENGILYNPDTDEIRYGHDNVRGKDLHQRVTIKRKNYYISRIVAEAFVPNDNPSVNIVVRHLDDNPLRNHYSNLKWGTHQENTFDGIRNKKIVYDDNRNYAKGENHGMASLTEDTVKSIINQLAQARPILMIAREFNVSPGVIYHIQSGRSWRHLSKDFLPFPKPINRLLDPISDEIKLSIRNMLHDDISLTPGDIIRELNLNDTNQIRTFIGYTKRKIKKEIC